jgi:hypothetical protein
MPLGTGRFVALTGATGRLLRTPSERLAQATHMAWVRGDAKLRAHNGRNPATCPPRPPEAVGFGAPLQSGRQAGELRIGQPTAGPRGWARAEGFRTTLAPTRHPVANGAFADPQGRRDLALRPTPLFEVPGLQASSFLPVVR